MKHIDFKALAPHGIAVLIMLILSVVFFSEELGGKKIYQSDNAQYKGMSKEIKDFRDATGEEPYWTNSMFGGMPAYQISVIHPEPVLKPIDSAMRLFTKGGLGKLFLYMLGFYILLVVLKVDYRLAILGAIAYGFASYQLVILAVGHNTKALALGYAPAVIGAFLMLFKERQYMWGTAFTALFLGLQVKSNHPQITYYLLILLLCLGLFYLVDAIKNSTWGELGKSLALFIGASMIAIGLSAPRLLSTMEYSSWSTRGASELTPLEGQQKSEGLDIGYATNWSYGIDESLTLLVPNYKGGTNEHAVEFYNEDLKGASQESKNYMRNIYNNLMEKYGISLFYSYWGTQPSTSGPVYIGALIVLLSLIGFWYVQGPLKWGLLLATILSLMLAWGKNFMPFTEFFFEYVPMYNKFRAVSMALTIAGLSLPLMAVLGLQAIIKKREEIAQNMTGLYVMCGTIAGLLLLMLLTPHSFQDFVPDLQNAQFTDSLKQMGLADAQAKTLLQDLGNVRANIFRSDVVRSLFIILLGITMLWLYIKDKVKANVLVIVLAAVTLLDLWTVDKRYLGKEKFVTAREMQVPFSPTNADKQILKDKDPYFRVFNFAARPDQDAPTSYFHKNVGGYHAAKPRRFEELIYRQLAKQNLKILNMLNVKYFIQQDPQSGKLVSMPNSDVLGNAWFVDRLEIVENADAEMAGLEDIRLEEYALMDKRFEELTSAQSWNEDPNASITLSSYAPNKLVFKSKRSSDGFAVFADAYYQPGWNATIDGQAVDHTRVNYVLRGMEVPAGEHEIVFSFEPKSIQTGNTIAYASSLVLVLLLLGGIYTSFIRDREED